MIDDQASSIMGPSMPSSVVSATSSLPNSELTQMAHHDVWSRLPPRLGSSRTGREDVGGALIVGDGVHPRTDRKPAPLASDSAPNQHGRGVVPVRQALHQHPAHGRWREEGRLVGDMAPICVRGGHSPTIEVWLFVLNQNWRLLTKQRQGFEMLHYVNLIPSWNQAARPGHFNRQVSSTRGSTRVRTHRPTVSRTN